IPPTFAEDGEDVQVIIEEEVIGKSVKMHSDRFAEKYKVQYQTIVYDAKAEAVVADLYIVFNEVSPSSAFDMSLENGTAYTPELTFRATSNEGGEIGTGLLLTENGRMILEVLKLSQLLWKKLEHLTQRNQKKQRTKDNQKFNYMGRGYSLLIFF